MVGEPWYQASVSSEANGCHEFRKSFALSSDSLAHTLPQAFFWIARGGGGRSTVAMWRAFSRFNRVVNESPPCALLYVALQSPFSQMNNWRVFWWFDFRHAVGEAEGVIL